MGYIIGDPGSKGDFIGRLLVGSTTFNRSLQMCANVPSVAGAQSRGAGPSNILFLFGVRDATSHWYAGLDLTAHVSFPFGSGLVIGRYSMGVKHPEVHLSFTDLVQFDRNQRFLLALEVVRTGSVVEIDVSIPAEPTWTVHAETTTDYMFDGQVGFGSYGSSLNVHHFGYGECPELECDGAAGSSIS